MKKSAFALLLVACAAFGISRWIVHREKVERERQAMFTADAVAQLFRASNASDAVFGLSMETTESELRSFEHLAETDQQRAFSAWLRTEVPRAEACHNLMGMSMAALNEGIVQGCTSNVSAIHEEAVGRLKTF